MGILFANFAEAKLATPPTGTGGLTFSVGTGKGALFPSAGSGDWFYGIFTNAARSVFEIVMVVTRTGDAMTIDAAGRGLDGTTARTWTASDYFYHANPKAFFDTVLLKTGGVMTGNLQLPAGTVSAPGLNLGNTQSGWYRPDTHILAETINGTERRRTTADGYAKFSNDGTYVGDTGTYHEFRQTAANSEIVLFTNTHATDPFGIGQDWTVDPDNNTKYAFRFRANSLEKLIIWSDGDVVNDDNSYGGISDERLKENIVKSGSQWDDVKNLVVIKYQTKSDLARYGADAKVMLGFSAQQVRQVSPGLVLESPVTEYYEEQMLDAETGIPLVGKTVRRERMTGETVLSVQHSIANMKLFKAFQEAQERIEQLEGDVAALITAVERLPGAALP